MHAFRSILLAITKQHTSDLALKQSLRLAADNRAKLLITVFDSSLEAMRRFHFLPLEQKLENLFRHQLEEELVRLKELAWEEGVNPDTRIVSGRPRQAIYQVIDENRIDLVIKLADTSGAFDRKQLTGNDLALLRKCPVPLLMMSDRDQLPDFTGKIMVALDVGDPDSEAHGLNIKLLQYGLYLAAQEQAQLHLVTVWGLPLARSALQALPDESLYELQEMTRTRYEKKLAEVMEDVGLKNQACKGISVKSHVIKGEASIEIQRLANELDVDLIVMGTLGRHSRGILIGNTAENILNGVFCSILAVKPEGYIYPQGLTH